MEWSPGELIWFEPGIGHWLPGEILEFHKSANVITVHTVINGKNQTFALSDGDASIRKREDLGTNGLNNLIELNDLHESPVLWNLKMRYEKNVIYTYIGRVLVAVNPYKTLNTGYDVESAKNYKDKLLGELPPHLFAIGAAAYAALPHPQVIIATGESGSGKTETIKLMMQYLATTTTVPKSSRSASTSGLVTEQILETVPLLEAFGNARTSRNDNSSRFGKYLEIYFKRGSIVGAKITQYLLQKSRIVLQVNGERNYHIFYELLGGLSFNEKQKYGLVSAEKYFYLNQGGGDCDAGHCGSGADWRGIKRSMEVMGIDEAEQDAIVKVLSTVLHLGNIYFHRKQLRNGQECVEFGSDAELRWISHLLKIPITSLQKCLTARFVETRNERIFTPLTIDQALDVRDALAKTLYSAVFNWIVCRINSVIQRGGLHDANRISLLDIFGFENLLENSFEQFCINFASESLQHYFNKICFKLEQQEYFKERLEWTALNFDDNSSNLHLLGKKPVGILHLLDDESNFPRASDASFLEKCHYNHALNDHYSRPRAGNFKEFGIRHYAGQVWYNVEGFLENNRDILRKDILEVLEISKDYIIDNFLRPMLSQMQFKTLPRETDGRFLTMKPRNPTIAARFGDGLHQLFDSMSHSNAWFIRCIKPNNEKLAMRFDMNLVLHQLKYLGIVNTIKIRKYGYPHKMKFQGFVDRYKYLLKENFHRGLPYKDICREIFKKIGQYEPDDLNYQLGTTRVFMREHLERKLEYARANILMNAAIVLQKYARSFICRKKYKSMKQSCIVIQKTWKRYKQRQQYLQLKKAAITVQSFYRGRKQRKKFRKILEEFHFHKSEPKKIEKVAFQSDQAQNGNLPKTKSMQTKSTKSSFSPSLTPSPSSSRKLVNFLEIPAELAFIYSKMDNYELVQSERNLMRVSGGISGKPTEINLPSDLNQYNFNKFCETYFQGAEPCFRSEPISVPFLSKATARDQDFQDAVAVFKLILRWSNDSQLTLSKEKVLADYIVYKGFNSRGLRDEILIQLCNQAFKNSSADRIWHLMAHCLSGFQPSSSLSKYLLKFVTDFATNGYKELLQQKILKGFQKIPHTRKFPSNILEWRSMKQKSHMAMPLTFYDTTVSSVYVDSWITCEEMSILALQSQEIQSTIEGWSVVLDDNGSLYDGNGFDFAQDLISEIEMCAAFPISKSSALKLDVQKKQNNQQSLQKLTIPAMSTFKSSSSIDFASEYGDSNEVISNDHHLQYGHFFENEKTRSRSLDNLLSEEPSAETLSNSSLLKTNRFNNHHHLKNQSVENLMEIDSRLSCYLNSNEDFNDDSATMTGQKHLKSHKKKLLSLPIDSYDRIDSFRIKSSAMSDTSEAPSLASHVKRVRVPSQASDVDQFLDELFNPVLDGNLDDISDIRSLAASIKGGGEKKLDKSVQRMENSSNVDDYISDLFNPIFVNENLPVSSDPSLINSKKNTRGIVPKSSVSNSVQENKNQVTENGLQHIEKSEGLSYQQNLQRAFLQSAMAQNIQIQQQLLAQNQALQKLLSQNNNKLILGEDSEDVDVVPIKTTGKFDKNGYKSPPPPPPMPPPLHPTDPLETRHFMDPYGRAKTVRIGKWRWPPPKDTAAENEEDGFLQFKIMRQNQKSKSQLSPNSHEWDEIDFEEIPEKPKKNYNNNQKKAFEIGAARPTPGSIGKLKLSSEMRQRLEKVTANHSIRSNGSSVEKPGKLEDTRKMMLEQQLSGRNWNIINEADFLAPPKEEIRHQNRNGWKPDQLLPSPDLIPPVPTKPAPEPPKFLEKRDSFLTHRQNRDTLGAHRSTHSYMENNHIPIDNRSTDVYNSPINGNDDDDENKNSFTNNWKTSNEFMRNEADNINQNMAKIKISNERPTFKTHQLNRAAKDKDKKTSNSIAQKIDIKEWQDLAKKKPETFHTPNDAPKIVHHLNNYCCLTYSRIPWSLRVRKDYFTPSENMGSPQVVHLIFCQIVSDVLNLTPCLRLSINERRAAISMLNNYDINGDNFTGKIHKAQIKRHVIDLARSWPLYFSKLFLVSGANQMSKIEIIAISHWGIHFVKRDSNYLQVLHSISLLDIVSCLAPRPSTLTLESNQGKITLHTSRALQIVEMVLKFCSEKNKLQPKISSKLTNGESSNAQKYENKTNGHQRLNLILKSQTIEDGHDSVNSRNKNTLQQFALQFFNHSSEFQRNKEKLAEVLKWQNCSLKESLLSFHDEELSILSVECFDSILQYCGDSPMESDMSEVKCVYSILMHCHKYRSLCDEIYCQLLKQLTLNKSENGESVQRLWRLLSIFSAYFVSSDNLLPVIVDFFTTAASERKRSCYGIAAICLGNLRKSQRYGGRKNVPSVEEVTAVSAGRSARRQIYRLPGGAERIVNTRCSTVVDDVIAELCDIIGVHTELEQQEFSIYCIVQGDAFTMPLASDEYILDVTTELQKTNQPFYLIFCRSVWFHPLRNDTSPLYTEVLFNQIAPDYLEGLLLRIGNSLPTNVIQDIALIACLLHRAADFTHSPTLKEIKFLLPKPLLGFREPRPQQWLQLVQQTWNQILSITVQRSKHRVLEILATWSLFGSSFFAVKKVIGDIDNWIELILALNRNGVLFLDLATHETVQHWPFSEVISTRKVRSEDGALFLDLKCGNLMQQKVTRLQSDQAHEISRLIRQYINLEQIHLSRTPR